MTGRGRCPWGVRWYSLLLAGLVLLVLGGCARGDAPRVVAGVLDLSRLTPASAGLLVRLNGDWAFYWHRLLTPADLPAAPSAYLAVPGGWQGAHVDGQALPRYGYGTYALHLRLGQPGGRYGIAMRYACTSYKLWVDGQPAGGDGEVGTSRAGAVAQFLPRTYYFTPAGSTVDLVIQVADFNHRCDGLSASPEFGTAQTMQQAQARNDGVQMILLGAILIMGLYQLAVFSLRREDRAPLYLGLFCLIVAVRSIVTGDLFLIRLFPGFPWGIELRLEYLTDYLALPVFFVLLGALYPREVRRWAIGGCVAVGLAGIASLVAPVRVSSTWIPAYEALVVGFIFYGCGALVVAGVRGRAGAWLFLLGCVAFWAGVVHDILSDNRILVTGEILPFGLFILVLFQSVILARRFAVAFAEVRHTHRLLTEREERVRKEIAEMLHGRVQSRLLLAGQRLQAAASLVPRDAERALALLADAVAHIDGVREHDVRLASHRLHPAVIDLGLVPAVRSLVDAWEEEPAGEGLRVTLRVDAHLAERDQDMGGGLPEAVRLAAYRVLEEALNNVRVHAEAHQADVGLDLTAEGWLRLSVEDDGRGLSRGQPGRGLGLRAVAARVAELGGRWELVAGAGQGARLTAWFPLAGGGRGLA